MTSPSDSIPVPPHRAGGGLLITDGGNLVVGPVQIEFVDGKVVNSSIPIRAGRNLCPIWAGIALDHLLHGQKCREAVLAAWRGTDNNALGSALIDESTACMQAIAAAATTVDALYSGVKEHIAIPRGMAAAWRQKRTARYKQITEVLRRGFGVEQSMVVRMQDRLKQIYDYRGWALHPPAEARAPVSHPALVGWQTEWRFVAFSYPNAHELVRRALSLSWETARHEGLSNKGLQGYCRSLKVLLEPAVGHWEAAFGPLAQQAPNPPRGHGLK